MRSVDGKLLREETSRVGDSCWRSRQEMRTLIRNQGWPDLTAKWGHKKPNFLSTILTFCEIKDILNQKGRDIHSHRGKKSFSFFEKLKHAPIFLIFHKLKTMYFTLFWRIPKVLSSFKLCEFLGLGWGAVFPSRLRFSMGPAVSFTVILILNNFPPAHCYENFQTSGKL